MVEPSLPPKEGEVSAVSLHPLRALTGAIIAAILGILGYRMSAAIALSFANHPITSANHIVHNLSAAVRTLVVGMAALATGICTLIALGLVGLALQIAIQRLRPTQPNA